MDSRIERDATLYPRTSPQSHTPIVTTTQSIRKSRLADPSHTSNHDAIVAMETSEDLHANSDMKEDTRATVRFNRHPAPSSASIVFMLRSHRKHKPKQKRRHSGSGQSVRVTLDIPTQVTSCAIKIKTSSAREQTVSHTHDIRTIPSEQDTIAIESYHDVRHMASSQNDKQTIVESIPHPIPIAEEAPPLPAVPSVTTNSDMALHDATSISSVHHSQVCDIPASQIYNIIQDDATLSVSDTPSSSSCAIHTAPPELSHDDCPLSDVISTSLCPTLITAVPDILPSQSLQAWCARFNAARQSHYDPSTSALPWHTYVPYADTYRRLMQSPMVSSWTRAQYLTLPQSSRSPLETLWMRWKCTNWDRAPQFVLHACNTHDTSTPCHVAVHATHDFFGHPNTQQQQHLSHESLILELRGDVPATGTCQDMVWPEPMVLSRACGSRQGDAMDFINPDNGYLLHWSVAPKHERVPRPSTYHRHEDDACYPTSRLGDYVIVLDTATIDETVLESWKQDVYPDASLRTPILPVRAVQLLPYLRIVPMRASNDHVRDVHVELRLEQIGPCATPCDKPITPHPAETSRIMCVVGYTANARLQCHIDKNARIFESIFPWYDRVRFVMQPANLEQSDTFANDRVHLTWHANRDTDPIILHTWTRFEFETQWFPHVQELSSSQGSNDTILVHMSPNLISERPSCEKSHNVSARTHLSQSTMHHSMEHTHVLVVSTFTAAEASMHTPYASSTTPSCDRSMYTRLFCPTWEPYIVPHGTALAHEPQDHVTLQ